MIELKRELIKKAVIRLVHDLKGKWGSCSDPWSSSRELLIPVSTIRNDVAVVCVLIDRWNHPFIQLFLSRSPVILWSQLVAERRCHCFLVIYHVFILLWGSLFTFSIRRILSAKALQSQNIATCRSLRCFLCLSLLFCQRCSVILFVMLCLNVNLDLKWIHLHSLPDANHHT